MLSNLLSIVSKRKRIGRGGSRGGTSGRGHKGQKARSGGQIPSRFEGGQMPLTRRLPKRGFTNARFKIEYEVINIKQLDTKFDDGAVINKEALIEKGVIKGGKKTLIKLLANGTLDKKLIVHVDAISKSAQEVILSKGGEVHVTKEM